MKTYSPNDEDAMQDALPAWLKMMRFLVFGLLILMICALFAIIYAALTLNIRADGQNMNVYFENANIGEKIADRLNDDGSIVILHARDGKRYMTEMSPDGLVLRETGIAPATIEPSETSE